MLIFLPVRAVQDAAHGQRADGRRSVALALEDLEPTTAERGPADAMRELSRAWRAAAEEEPGYEFRARAALSEFVFLLGAHAPSPASAPPERVLQDNKRIKLMLEYVQAHFAEALPMRRFTAAERRTKPSMSGMPPRPVAFRSSAPFTAPTRWVSMS